MAQENTSNTASKAGVLLYGLGDLASQFVWTFVGTYLTVFYTDIVGLAPAAVSAIMLGARIWDAFNDPMMGALAERTRSRWGRFRPWIAFGCPFLAIFSVLTFTNPFSGTSAAGVLYAAVIYILAGMLYTLVNIPYGALAAVMTEDASQRVTINTSRNIGMNLGMLIVNGFSASLMLKFSEAGSEVATRSGYTKTAIIYAIISIPMFLLVFLFCKEKIQPQGEPAKFSVSDTVNNLIKNKYLMILSVVMALAMTALFGRIAVASFYVIYCMGSFTLIAMFLTVPTACGIIGSFSVPFLVKKFGKRNALSLTMTISGIGLLVIFFSPYQNTTMIIVGSVIFGLANVAMPITLSMLADAVDYMDLESGVRTDGTAYATYGLATKVGNALGGSVGVVLMAAFGYVANQQQTPQAMQGINIVVNLLPAVLYFLAAAGMMLFWKMSDKDADEIRAKLNERNAGKA